MAELRDSYWAALLRNRNSDSASMMHWYELVEVTRALCMLYKL